MGLTIDSKCTWGRGGHFFSAKNGRAIALPATPPSRSLEFYHMQLICMIRNLYAKADLVLFLVIVIINMFAATK